MQIFNKKYSKAEILKKVGDISQIAGIRLSELKEGNEKGVDTAEMRSGSGFRVIVTLGRGMDIGYAEYCGIPLCFRSSAGDAGASFYEPEGLGWLRTFSAGMINTCGLTYMGFPCEDQGEKLGLHGRINHIPAKNIYADCEWLGNEYVLTLKGKMRETRLFGENIILTRVITMKLGESRFFLHDRVENMGYRKTEHMILYHCNVGFPVLDNGAELISPTVEAVPRDKDGHEEKNGYAKFTMPVKNCKEKVYRHKLKSGNKGFVQCAVANRGYDNGKGIGVYVKYPAKELPVFTEWKMMGEGIYAVGMEPGNAFVTGRDKARMDKTLQFLKPGEKRDYHLELGVLKSNKEINEFEKQVRSQIANCKTQK